MLAIRELYVGLTATAAVSAASAFWLHFSRFSSPAVLGWARGIFALFIALALMSFRGQISPLFTIVLANVVSVLAHVFLWQGIRTYLGRPHPGWLAGIVWGVAGSGCLSLISPELVPVRISMLCLAFIFFNIFMGWDLLCFSKGRRTAILLAWNYLVNAIVIFLRWGEILFTQSYDVYYTTGWTTAAYVLWTHVSLLFMTLCLMIMMVEDLSDRLARSALKDPLTHVYNRRAFHGITPEEMGKLKADHGPLGLLLLDIDFFKGVNDTHGHAVGDSMLIHFSREVASCLRSNDLFYRIGGEEFVVLLPGIGTRDLWNAGERIRRHIESHPLELPNGQIGLTVSIGGAVVSESDGGISALLNRADGALYQAKAKGRNRVICAPSPGM